MQVINSFVIINLNKNEHFLCNRIILVMKVLLPANTYCKIFTEKLEKIYSNIKQKCNKLYSTEILMQLIKSFVNINLNKMSILCAIESFGHESSTSCKYILQNIYEKLEQI